ncbi:hypothetical protein HW132_18005 [Brasilonema sp. CT11]|nr:hypothetical protein [Brasilonema sp. CT11]
MSRIRLYLDEDTIKRALIQALRNADLGIITVADADRLGYPDEEQLQDLRILTTNCHSECSASETKNLQDTSLHSVSLSMTFSTLPKS